MPPFILLAFSNKQDSYLQYLNQECEEIRKILLGLRDRVDYEILERTTTEGLFNVMSARHNQITVFHYGGHADSLQLELENRPQGITQFVQLLKGMANLQLIFLNGCSTHGMVSKILEQMERDVAVIATATKIDDQRAFDFSKAFYAAFTQESQTLEGAFEMAKSVLSAEDIRETSFRQSVPSLDPAEPTALMPWGVYGKEVFAKKIQLIQVSARVEPTQVLPGSLAAFKTSLKKHLAKGEVDEAIELAEQKFGYDNDTLVNLMGRWNRFKKELNQGTVAADFAKVQENQIRNSILGWVDDLDEEDWS
jgi:hypothetical protein